MSNSVVNLYLRYNTKITDWIPFICLVVVLRNFECMEEDELTIEVPKNLRLLSLTAAHSKMRVFAVS